MTTEQKIAALTIRMIKHINTCLENKMDLGEVFDYIHQDLDLNDKDINNLFTQVFHNNYKMEQFARP